MNLSEIATFEIEFHLSGIEFYINEIEIQIESEKDSLLD